MTHSVSWRKASWCSLQDVGIYGASPQQHCFRPGGRRVHPSWVEADLLHPAPACRRSRVASLASFFFWPALQLQAVLLSTYAD